MALEVSRFQIVRGTDLSELTGQSAGAVRMAGVSAQNTAATRIWLGKVRNEPGHFSVPHHHGDAETAGYVLKGRAWIAYGDGFEKKEFLNEGDFVFVPPNFPHIEGNASEDEELIWMTARTPDNIVINLD
jgi:uncharacterized RmlC-like cupin family protein